MAVLTLVSILACLLLLWITARKKIVPHGDNTTGHVWDEDLREMNNPMPRWWMWLFVLTIVFGLLLPGRVSGPGQLRRRAGLDARAASTTTRWSKAKHELAPLYAQFTARKAEDLAGDPSAMAIGERLFLNNCAQCHGSDARGSKGFPNLTDSDWLHGGTPDKIDETITEGRHGQMPPMAAAVGSRRRREERRQLRAEPVGQPARLGARAARQEQVHAPAPPATASTARATRRWARPT